MKRGDNLTATLYFRRIETRLMNRSVLNEIMVMAPVYHEISNTNPSCKKIVMWRLILAFGLIAAQLIKIKFLNFYNKASNFKIIHK